MNSRDAGEVVQVLAGVVEVHDLGGLGELAAGDVPDPGGAVAEDRELADVIGAAADAFGLDQAGEHGRGLEGGDVAGGVPVPDRVAVIIELVLGEEHGELDLAGAGAAVLALAVPPRGLLRGHGHAGAVDDGIQLVRQRGRRQRHQFAGGDQRGPVPDGGGLRGAAGLGGPLDALGGQPHPGQVLQQPRRPSRTARRPRPGRSSRPGPATGTRPPRPARRHAARGRARRPRSDTRRA